MTEASLLLTFCVFSAAFGVALGWLLRAKVEIATETDPESELRNLRSKQALYASKIRSLHLELAQLESKLATLKASGVDVGQPIEPVPLDDAAMDARLASIIGSFEDEERAEASRLQPLLDEDEQGSGADEGFRSILPSDLVGERTHALDEAREAAPEVEDDEPVSLPADQDDEDGMPRRLVSGDLYERVAAALANEAGDQSHPDDDEAGDEAEHDEPAMPELADTGGRDHEQDLETAEAEPSEVEVPALSDQTVEYDDVDEVPEPTLPALRVVPDAPEDDEEPEQDAAARWEPADEAVTIDLRESDDLTLIRGVGPKAAEMLVEQGFTRFADLGRLDDEELADLADNLGSFRNKIVKEDWRGQARALADQESEVSVTGR